MPSRRVSCLAAALAASLASAAPAHATCGTTACFLSTLTQEGTLGARKLRLDVSYRFVDQSRRREGSSSTGEVLTPGVDFANGELELGHHRELKTGFHVLQADASYGITSRLSLLASLPLLSVKHHEHVVIEDGEERFTSGDGSSGVGDVQLGARYALLPTMRDLVLATFSVELPTGAHRRLDTAGEITEPSLQPGSGSTDVIGSVLVSHQVQPRRTEVFVTGTVRHNGTSDLDYKMGDELQAGAGVTRLLSGGFTGSVQVNLRHGGRDRFLGEDVPNTGSTLVNVTPGVRYQASSSLALYAFVPVPLYQKVNEAQLTPKIGLVAGLSRQF